MARKHPKKERAATPVGTPDHAVEAPSWRWQRGVERDASPVERGGRAIQRVGSGLVQLHRGGTVGDAEVAAAARWQRDAEPANEGSTNPEVRSASAGPDSWMVGRLAGASRHREACQAVGIVGVRLLRAFVSEQLSIRAVARRTAEAEVRDWEAAGSVELRPDSERTNRRRLTEELAATLTALADHYAVVDRARRAAARAARVAVVEGVNANRRTAA